MHQNKHQNTNQHLPVLLEEVLKYLDPQSGESFLDLTAGYGGHAAAVLARTGNPAQAVLVDRDAHATAVLREKYDEGKAGSPSIRLSDFLAAARELQTAQQQFDLILADLGVSSPHLNEAARGFSIARNGPLDMRMDQSQAMTAATILNTFSEAALADILQRYGQEPKARQIARGIIAARPLQTTEQLATIARQAWPGHSRVHPATRTFQALRIAVNDELSQLEEGLPLWIELLQPAGRLVVISFHSLEDRLVKQALQDAAGNRYDADLRLLTKRPVSASASESVLNPRARSAKLRAAVKIKKKGN